MIKKLQVPKLFLACCLICYLYIILVIYVIINQYFTTSNTESPEKVLATVELAYVRMMMIVVAFFGYPIVLFSYLKYAKHVTIALTAWAIAMYIDDQFILYKILEYPDEVSVRVVLLLRPILLICLIWMSFELTYNKSTVE